MAVRRLSFVLSAAVLAGIPAGCSTGGHTSSPTTTAPPTTSVSSTTGAGAQTGGPRTVLSPTGLNVRKAPNRSAPVLGTAAQGVVLTTLGYTASDGGWFQVKGETVTGWISAQPTLSAAGEFHPFGSPQFSALYPATWSEEPHPPSSVVFRAPGGGDIVATSAASVSKLPDGRNGYGRQSVTQVVVCGTTAALVIFEQPGLPATTGNTAAPASLPYLAQVRLPIDKQHALGLYADMPDLDPTLQIFKEFLASVSYPAPQCEGG